MNIPKDTVVCYDNLTTCPNATDHLAGMFTISCVDIDQRGYLLENTMAKLAA